MANMKYNFSSGSNGKITYNSDIVNSIVAIAVQEVEGVDSITPNKGIRLFFEKDGVYVDVSVVVKYSNSIPELAFRIQQSIKQSVESMTKYKIAKVDAHVQDVVFSEEPVQPTSASESPRKAENAENAENAEEKREETKKQ